MLKTPTCFVLVTCNLFSLLSILFTVNFYWLFFYDADYNKVFDDSAALRSFAAKAEQKLFDEVENLRVSRFSLEYRQIF